MLDQSRPRLSAGCHDIDEPGLSGRCHRYTVVRSCMEGAVSRTALLTND